ncbi:TatD family hydrolase [bacterium]|nr:TatD family hydrolase [bacterium]
MAPLSSEVYFVDTHAHINLLKDSSEHLQTALEQKNVKWVLVPGYDLPSSKQAVALARNHDWILPAVGIHPHDAFPDWTSCLSFIREQADLHKIAAIGEIGLDRVRSKSLPENQIRLLEEQLQIAEEFQLPVIIHNREQDQEVESVLDQFPNVKGILHCYSSPETLALKKIEQGWLISFSFNITYPKSDFLRDLLKKIPLSSLLLETDSPYLAPLFDRGKRDNSPLNIPILYQWVSEWLSIPLEVLCEKLMGNFTRLLLSNWRTSHD